MKQTNIFTFVFTFLLVLSFASAIAPSFSFITPLNDSIITDNSFTLINLSVVGYSEVSLVEDFGGVLLNNDGNDYWYYSDWVVVSGKNVVPLEFCDSESCDYANLTFYNLPISFVSPASLVNSLFVDINVSAPGYTDVSFTDGDGSALFENSGDYWYNENYKAVEGVNNINISFCVDEDTCTTRMLTFTVDLAAPNIYLVGGNVTLTVGDVYTDAGATANDTVSGDLTSEIINSSNVNTAVAGTYLVQYSVTDDAGNSAFVNRTVIVNSAEAPASSGGGGSGSCTTQWTVSEWSSCVDGTQTRTVSYPANYCTPRAEKPLESRTCTVPSNVNNTELNQLNNQTTQPGFVNRITGAVIGTNTGRWSLAVVLFLLLVGLAWWIIAAKKRRVAKVSVKKKK